MYIYVHGSEVIEQTYHKSFANNSNWFGDKFKTLYFPDYIISYAGQAGYVVLGIRDVKKAIIGDIFHHADSEAENIVPSSYTFKQPTPMVRTQYQLLSLI